jgi:hypothetical protein
MDDYGIAHFILPKRPVIKGLRGTVHNLVKHLLIPPLLT